MTVNLRTSFDGKTLARGRDYASRGLVSSCEALSDNELEATVSNGRDSTYQQRISLDNGRVDGLCSCPVGHNCKHVAAVMIKWVERRDVRPGFAAPIQGWLRRVKETTTSRWSLIEARPEDYPAQVKDRLLYVLVPHGQQVRIDIFRGRENAARTGLNKSIRRYDAMQAVRSAAPANFIKTRGRPRPSGRGGIAKGRSIGALRLDRPLLSA